LLFLKLSKQIMVFSNIFWPRTLTFT